MTVTRRSIWRMTISMCLSWIGEPWEAYTFWTSSTKCSCTRRTPRTRSTSWGSMVPPVSCSPTLTWTPSAIWWRTRFESSNSSRARRGRRYSTSAPPSSRTIVSLRPRSVSSIRTRPSASAIGALPFGVRASKSSTTRGRPCVMSSPATPPVWKVRIVSWVPGSPMDWAAWMPTASPTSTRRLVASEVP